ncbi:hypothetical protein Acr_09g0005290 [Actinidia rufa]|uniref:Retrovirus-related Pol polyprotein from transposon TNT 1-94-like beta-barrel domain-containing protein n=1 Tax=Actinidia rufa TaxID=165716 RepID=A0A7J0F650_9ERIC|nr:hypothetical protein Acr_09g0005290 [Actinidia rufa]
MEDILFCKDLHNSLKNKGEKLIAMKDEKWRKMNKKTIGLIRQYIGHEVFHHVAQETSAYELWIKLEEMYQAKTSQNKSLIDEEACEFEALERDYSDGTYERVSEFESWETLVVSLSNSALNGKLTTSLVMDALFNEDAWRREMGSTDQSESQALVSEGSRERGRGQGRGHHRDTAAITVMADEDESDILLATSEDGKSDWVLDSGSAYHLCRDREIFSTYAACKGRIWIANNTFSRVVGRWNSESFQGKQGDVVGKEDWKAIPIEGKCLNKGATVRHRSSGISKKSGQGKEAQRKETKSILRSCTAKGAATPKRISFALDLISGGNLSSCAHKGGEIEPRQLAKCIHFDGKWSSSLMRLGILDAVLQSYGGAGSEAVKKDNLKTSDYPLVGWRGEIVESSPSG